MIKKNWCVYKYSFRSISAYAQYRRLMHFAWQKKHLAVFGVLPEGGTCYNWATNGRAMPLR
ncbi:MAG: hypothetical protein J6U06_00815 [Spirochaetaceae bacterium]|nr:hypothetical protein [Spirochaetaceae bacterium]